MKSTIRLFLSVAIIVTGLGSTVAAQTGPLQVGAAKVDITHFGYPDGEVPITAYEHERLYMRAILLDNGETRAALIGSDTSGLDGVWEIASPLISEEFEIPVQHILMSAQHTHGARMDNAQGFTNAILKALALAETGLQPARMGYGEGSAYLNANRNVIDKETRRWTQDTNLDAYSDKTVAVLAFYDPQGAPIAGYMNYAMHPVTSYLTGIITADFPGAASRHVEQAFGDKTIMIFSKGLEGDQNPRTLRPGTNVMASLSGVEVTGFELVREQVETPFRDRRLEGDVRNPVLDRAFMEWVQAQGMVLGEEAIRVMSHMDRLQDDVRIAGSQMVLACPGRDLVERVPRGDPGTYRDGPDAHIQMGLIGINDVAIGSITSDAFAIIGKKIKEASPLRKTMLVSHANLDTDDVGYIYDDAGAGQNTFQVVQSRLKPGCAETGLVENFTDMIYDYLW
ncbi:MAG: hypothetical protein OER22_05915 [Gammaproteobacteria bacterium]|nr:hypothetical protein [Gammaproteobacteria bacterium]MDH3373379.1 hypothetical protein [Gammaproteobacteria bacterium]MDH3552134.1 hypothetical protein [Gammaproteobacteria bacterium]